MTDRPITFSAPMILALLGGRKTQTRCLTTSPQLWRHDHGSESYDANPELVALTFSVHRANIDALPAEVVE